jgi:hypothetical protein
MIICINNYQSIGKILRWITVNNRTPLVFLVILVILATASTFGCTSSSSTTDTTGFKGQTDLLAPYISGMASLNPDSIRDKEIANTTVAGIFIEGLYIAFNPDLNKFDNNATGTNTEYKAHIHMYNGPSSEWKYVVLNETGLLNSADNTYHTRDGAVLINNVNGSKSHIAFMALDGNPIPITNSK